MRRFCFILLMLLASHCLYSQTQEMFPRYTVVDVDPQITGEKSFEELQKEFQNQAPSRLNGRVRVDFLVLPSGAIGDCRINFVKPQGDEDLIFEAKKFVAQLPRFTPGLLKGEKVRVWKFAVLTFGDNQVGEESYNSTLGKILKKKTDTPRDASPSEEEIEQMPTFPGGVNSLVEYLATNIHYPVE